MYTGGEKRKGKKRKKEKKKKYGTCVEDKKRGKKRKEMVSQYFHNIFTINFKW